MNHSIIKAGSFLQEHLWLSMLLMSISAAAFTLLIPGSVLIGMKTALIVSFLVAAATATAIWHTGKRRNSARETSLFAQDVVSSWKTRLPRLLFDILLLVVFVSLFCRYAALNERFIHLTKQHDWNKQLLLAVGTGILGLTAFPFAVLLHNMLHIVLRKTAEKICSHWTGILFLRAVVIILVLTGLYYTLEVSTFGRPTASVLQGGKTAFLCNLCVLLLVEIFLALVFGNTKRALTVCSVIIVLWAIANYYVTLYHGSPLVFTEFHNFKTAMAVAGGYRYRITLEILIIILVGTAGLFLIRACAPALFWKNRFKASLLALCALAVSGILFSKLYPLVVADDSVGKGWRQSVRLCGFLVYSVEDLERRAGGGIIEPEHYSAASLPVATAVEIPGKTESEYPDVILILNESFCDLNVLLELDTETSALEDFYAIPCIARGYAVVSDVGGGTNTSEFELLMSKSKYLLSQGAPFTWLNDKQLSRSIVEYLKALGYETTGMHVEANNYNRNNAYRAIGFDHIYLGKNQPNSNASSYGNRPYTDSAFYEDLKLHYEEVDKSRPQFFFLLTLQNHAGYEENEASLDTVHVLNDYGHQTDDLNEFLSSVRLSAEALKELTEYYSTFDRKTVICMVGDHAPAMIGSMSAKEQIASEKELEIAQRMVPYIIWSNYDTDISGVYTDYVSMVDLAPMVLDAAGIPLSMFYSQILSLHDILPVRTSNSLVMNQIGEIYTYPEETEEWNGLLDQYYNLEYNSLLPEDEYRAELFEPMKNAIPIEQD